MTTSSAEKIDLRIKEPTGLSARIKWLRDYYFEGVKRKWNNENSAWSTGTSWDLQFPEFTYYIVPEIYMLLDTMNGGYIQAARDIELHPDFWNWS
ncbi:MAG: hypothetical protein HN580_07395, partial [Deltaproteobacteria bacterium]|nr:hypothetical protein [Deltaproteobacteria bacterium]